MGEGKIVKLSDLVPDDHNANAGNDRGRAAIAESLRRYGAGRSIVVDRNGKLIAGDKTLAEWRKLAAEQDVLLVQTDGTQLIVHQRIDLDQDSEEDDRAVGLALADNRTQEISLTWDFEELVGRFDDGMDLDFLWDEGEQAILREAVAGLDPGDGADIEVDLTAQPNPRQLPIDMIYTLQMADCTCCLAVQAGLRYGIQSAHYRLCPYVGELSGRHEVMFVDNDYFEYDHAIHLAAVRELKPKYATVRDVMTRQQCAEAGIEYYSLAQILDWAEELNQYAANVILIPKYDCLDQIPEKFMLGYSVPTSHGGTPLEPERFQGRRVHLLGGSWRAQLAYMAILGEDVVSVDNNYLQKQANYASFVYPDGSTGSLRDDLNLNPNNPRYAALAISFGNVGTKINELYGGSAQAAPEAVAGADAIADYMDENYVDDDLVIVEKN